MKFLHLADLHIGKRVCEHNMLEDQEYILGQVLEVVRAESPDAVLIAGDVYDKSVPSAEAVSVFDDFLVKLSSTGTKVFVISGNHDSAERIAFGGRLMQSKGVFMSPVYDGEFVPATLRDEFGEVDVWMLPFVRPADVRAVENRDSAGNSCGGDVPEAKPENVPVIADFTDAVRVAISKMKFTAGRRNVLLSHQFVTGAERSDSEENIGGLDNVDASVFAGFDYVAMGHIHKPQNVSTSCDEGPVARARYCGTPLKYSLSEAIHEKSVTVVELAGITDIAQNLAQLNVRTVPLVPLHDVRKVRGMFADIVSPKFIAEQEAAGKKLDDYVYVELTDEIDIPDAVMKLRGTYKNLMTLTYDNTRTRMQSTKMEAVNVKEKSPMELFEDFYKEQNGIEMSSEQRELMDSLIHKIWETDSSEIREEVAG